MTLPEREHSLIERYSLIEDRHERLNAIISYRLPERQMAMEERRDEWLVQGCASQVWLKVEVTEGNVTLLYAADSVMIRGLVALLVELYHGAAIAEAETFSPQLLEELGLDRILSATRLHGLTQIIHRIQRASHVD
ncbi:MAG TPA: SufE family protein [Chthoniobacterales bacterium]|jgi:cysteine desulfuration protein SufE